MTGALKPSGGFEIPEDLHGWVYPARADLKRGTESHLARGHEDPAGDPTPLEMERNVPFDDGLWGHGDRWS